MALQVDHHHEDGADNIAHQVASWLIHEQQCVSLATISLHGWSGGGMLLSRPYASELLQQQVLSSKDASCRRNYQVTKCYTKSVRHHQRPPEDEEEVRGDHNDDTENEEEVVPCTVFRLVATTAKYDDDSADVSMAEDNAVPMDGTEQECGWYAVAVQSHTPEIATESLSTAHERDMALFRDQLRDDDAWTNMDSGWEKENRTRIIAPAREICASRVVPSSETGEPMLESTVTVAAASASSSSWKHNTATLSRGPKQATTAASFFGGTKTTSQIAAVTTAASTAVPKKSTTVSFAEDGKENHSAAAKGKAPTTAKATTTAKTKKGAMTTTTKAAASGKKTNGTQTAVHGDTTKRKETTTKVGDADNFVGDMEEDDDDEDSIVADPLPKRNNSEDDDDESIQDDDDSLMDVDPEVTVAAAKSKRRDVVLPNDSDDEVMEDGNDKGDDEDGSNHTNHKPHGTKHKRKPVTGAMDAYATKRVEPKPTSGTTATTTTAHRRRRKTLVDKTTVDAHGYLHTETQEIWIDVPSDDDVAAATTGVHSNAQPPQPAKRAAATSKKNAMKQGNLMGFLKKK